MKKGKITRTYLPQCRLAQLRVQCIAEGPRVTNHPVLQSSSFPDPVPVGVGVWRPILETHSGESILWGVQGAKISTESCQKPPEAPPDTQGPPQRSPKGSSAAPGAQMSMVSGSILNLMS